MKSKKGFTVVELLTVVTIIAMLIGLLIPSLRMVRGAARDAKQRAQLTTIGMAISAFRNDYGDYPPSVLTVVDEEYSGIQKLTEALVGWDLMGFHPDSRWHYKGEDGSGNPIYFVQSALPEDKEENLKERRGPYLELATADAFKLEDLFTNISAETDGALTYVLCDVYKIKKITITSRANSTPIDTVKVGTPLLYYKANTSSKTIGSAAAFNARIYNANDNKHLVEQGRLSDGKYHPIAGINFYPTTENDSYENFYGLDKDGGIADSKITTTTPTWKWPVRPDSYILLSAGADGLYGTEDDITNFK